MCRSRTEAAEAAEAATSSDSSVRARRASRCALALAVLLRAAHLLRQLRRRASPPDADARALARY